MELKNLIRKRDTMTNELDHGVCKKWKELEEESKIDVLHRCQSQGKNTWIHLSYFDIDDVGTEQKLRWCDGVVEAISDGTWLVPGSCQKYKRWGKRQVSSGMQSLVARKKKRLVLWKCWLQINEIKIVNVHGTWV